MQITTSATKKIWEKSGSDVKVPNHGTSGLTPLQLHANAEPMWRDTTWSTQGETLIGPPRRYQQPDNNITGSAGILR